MTTRPSFAHGKSPMIVGVIKESTPTAAMLKMREGEFAGARGFDLHLSCLLPEFRTKEHYAAIIASTERPILALNYNILPAGESPMTEEERMQTLLDAAEAGASAVDMQGYTFDLRAKGEFHDDDCIPSGLEFLEVKRPKEMALSPAILEKQHAFIDRAHELGAEVLGSIHFGCKMTREELAACARFAREKGVDIVKMVATSSCEADVAEAIDATIYLKENLDFPFSYHLNGRHGLMTRKLCPLFGSHIMFCNVDYGPRADLEQLHVRSMVDAYRALGEL